MVKSRSSSSSSSGSGSGSGTGSGSSCYRGHWRPAEDDKLRQLVEQFGPQNWNFIAEHFKGRSGKSCRLRWYNQLDPSINKNPFTEEEEERLLIYQQLHGNKWALIARHFKGRTDNAVKNHYHVIMARRRRERFTIFGNKSSVHQNKVRSSRHSFAFPKHQSGQEKKWSPLTAPSPFNPPKNQTAAFELLTGGRRNSHAVGGEISKNAAAANPFGVLRFGDGNNGGGQSRMKMVGSSGARSGSEEDAAALVMKWAAAGSGEEKGGGGEQQKGTLPFIDFLGMGSS